MAVARRARQQPHPVIRFGDLEIDRPTRADRRRPNRSCFTAANGPFSTCWLPGPARSSPRTQIEEALYAFGSEIESNTVEVYVSRLRKKIGQDRSRPCAASATGSE